MRGSIITDDLETCFICKGRATEVHHVMHGWANRKIADKYGLTVGLCHRCHNEGPNGVHFNNKTDEWLKRIGQRAFEKEHGHKLWMELFGRNCLPESEWVIWTD